MSLKDLTREAVLAAVQEHDRVGPAEFLRDNGFKPAREYRLILDGKAYDSKAIAGVAHGFVGRGFNRLKSSDFSGGDATVRRVLERLGFTVERDTSLPSLVVGQVYSWEDIGQQFGFNPDLFQIGGGMLPRPNLNALLLITHPGGAKSFDYDDRWDVDGKTLIYTGRGKTGDQEWAGPNRDVGENRKQLVVLEAAGPKRLRYLGPATCTQHWTARGTDKNGNSRDVFKFRLAFADAGALPSSPSASAAESGRTSKETARLRTPRPFDPTAPAPRLPNGKSRSTPEEILAQQEKANQEHHRVLECLAKCLEAGGWNGIEEIPSAIDLWATTADAKTRVIFEVKTLSNGNEISQCRAALSQLLEYRFFYGAPTDRLCLVVNGSISDRRTAFLEEHGISILKVESSDSVSPIGRLGRVILTGLNPDS
jgi:hypothetical protein